MLSAYGYGEVLIVEGITPIILFFTARYTDDSAEYVPRNLTCRDIEKDTTTNRWILKTEHYSSCHLNRLSIPLYKVV